MLTATSGKCRPRATIFLLFPFMISVFSPATWDGMGAGLICNPCLRTAFMSPNIHTHTYTCTHVYTPTSALSRTRSSERGNDYRASWGGAKRGPGSRHSLLAKAFQKGASRRRARESTVALADSHFHLCVL